MREIFTRLLRNPPPSAEQIGTEINRVLLYWSSENRNFAFERLAGA
jgi:hypothetical protein